MGTIEKRGQNSWRVGIRKSTAQGRSWVRRNITFPADMPEEEQRKAAEVELARLIVDDAEGKLEPAPSKPAPPPSGLAALIQKYNISEADAAQLLGAQITAPAAQTYTITVQQLYDKWMEQHCIPELKRTTIKTYQALMTTRVLPLIGKRQVTSLTPMDMQELMTSIRCDDRKTTAIAPEKRKRKQDRERPSAAPKALSDRTVQHYYDTISDMFDRGVQWKLIPANPMEGVTRPKARKVKLKVLDDERAVALLRRLSQEESLSFRCAVMLALVCGLRLSEVGALTWDDVDWKRCAITVSRGLNYAPGHGNYIDTTKSEEGERTIDLPAGMMTLLQETKAWQDELAATIGDRWRGVGRIVCGWDGSPQHHDTPSKQFRHFADANGFEDIRFHDLRHTHATLLFANNMDAVAVAHRLGHSSPDTTFRFYAHAIRSRDAASAAAMQHYIDEANTPESTT